MRFLLILSIFAVTAAAQDRPDDRIRSEYQTTMELAAAPPQGEKLEEEAAKARIEMFRKSLEAFVEKWEGRAGELSEGKYWLGRALIHTGRLEPAIPHLKGFVEAHPKSPDVEEALMLLGSAYLDTRDAAAAAEVFSGILKDRPDSPKRAAAELYLGIARWRQDRAEEALAHFQAVIDSGGDLPVVADAHIHRIEALVSLGRASEARQHLAGLLEKNADAPALKALQEKLDWVGKEAPELASIDVWLQGEPVALKDLRGRVVVLNFFADKFESCQLELQAIAGLASRFQGRPLAVIGVTRYHRPKDQVTPEAEREKVKTVLHDLGVAFPVAMASNVANLHAYGVRGIPYTVVIGKDGRIVHVKTGGSTRNQWGLEEMAKAIERALGAG
jgi:peroxiredoxin/Flp pilus assembly protein TadD